MEVSDMLWRLRTVLLGLIVGLLISPGTGEENRRRFWLWLRGRLEEAQPVIEARMHDVTTQGRTVAEQSVAQARQQVTPLIQTAQAKLGEVGRAVPAPVRDRAGSVINSIGQMTNQSSGEGSSPASAADDTTGDTI
jgi:gas vesicle protein